MFKRTRPSHLAAPPNSDIAVAGHRIISIKGVLRSFFILDVLNVLIPESTLLFTRTQTERICLRYPQPIAQFFHVLKKRFDERYLLPEQDVSSLPLWRSKQRAGFSSLVCSREVISDIVLKFYCVQSLTSVFVSCFLFYWSTLVRLVSSLWRNRNKHWKGFATQRRVPPKPFFGDVTWGCGYLRQICSVWVRVKKRVLSGMSTFRISSMKNDRSTPLILIVF